MHFWVKTLLQLLACVAIACMLTACGPAINPHAQNTFLDSQDLVAMTDKMAASIAADPQVAAITAIKPMTIVMTSVENRTDEILPHPQSEIFLARVRALLQGKPELRTRFTFVLNRSDYQLLQAQEGITPEQLGPQEQRTVPEYAFKAVFYSDTHATGETRSDYYLCTYQLTELKSGALLWEGKYETKKAIARGFLD